MAFGSQATKPAVKTFADTKTLDIFFNLKAGSREFRIIPGVDEVRFRRIFFAKTDSGWEPTFGFNPNDKRIKKPVTIARFDAALGEDGQWEYGGDWGKNPVDAYVASLDVSEDERKKLYAKEYFVLCVYDRTFVKIDSEGTIMYPDARNKYPAGSDDVKRQRLHQVRILQGSSGKPRDEDGNIVGKHMYARLLRAASDELDHSGEPLQPFQFDIRVTTAGEGIDTDRSFVSTGNTDDINWSDVQVYDLRPWLRPWSFDAIAALMRGEATWDELMESQGIPLFPALVSPEIPF